MHSKTVKMYYCDFCKKRGQRAYYMRKHEEHCTLNPNRVCNVCGLMEQEQSAITDLVAVFAECGPSLMGSDDPNHGFSEYEEWRGGDTARVEAAMPTLREVAGNCPACIMAALRQSGIPVPLVESFNFTDEMQAVWSDFNATQRDVGNPMWY